jgi:hypothetical protein
MDTWFDSVDTNRNGEGGGGVLTVRAGRITQAEFEEWNRRERLFVGEDVADAFSALKSEGGVSISRDSLRSAAYVAKIDASPSARRGVGGGAQFSKRNFF